ncbi:flavin monoamine oxidase family protein [Ideonella sp.]|jgi:monoamine oxidase|uniref:flavin monoamine oxidase family protein n=1 Tax=Ideonella sp. TaxID=1929293 RepID=UPI0037C0F684
MSLPIVIIGAGLSGLYASHLLNKAGHDTVLVEARARLGGRVLSHAVGEQGHRLDMGPAWFWPAMNPRMLALIERLGLRHFAQFSEGALVVEGPDGNPQRRPTTWEQAPPSHRIAGGVQQLTEALAAQLEARTHIKLNTTLLGMKLRPHGVELELQDDGGRWQQLARQVILTIPPRLLAQDVPMIPEWPQALMADMKRTSTWMAGQAKFLAAYATPFWREQGLSGTAVSHRGPLSEIHDASDSTGSQAALFGLVGASSDYRRAIGPEELKRQSLAQLTRMFGAAAAHPLWSEVQDWAWEPHTATAADQRPLAYHPSYRRAEVPAPWSSRLWLAGTERSPNFGGYLGGALEAAELAVEGVLISTEGQALETDLTPTMQRDT